MTAALLCFIPEVMFVQAQLRAALVCFAYPPPPFSADLLCKIILCHLYLYEASCCISAIHGPILSDRAGGCLRHWSSRSCNLFYGYLVYKQLCSRRGKCFHLPRVAKSLEVALVISVISLKPILSHFECKGEKVQSSQLNSCR